MAPGPLSTAPLRVPSGPVNTRLMDPSVLDTLAFAPAPVEQIRSAAIASRPGIRLVDTPTSWLRVRVVEPVVLRGATVVCFPDGPNTLEHYDELAGLLADAGHRVAVLEIPGFGFSWATSPEALTFQGTVDATVFALDQLALGPAILAGVCVQAHVALRAAVQRPDLAAGLLLAQCTGWKATTRWGGEVLDSRGALREPWAGQARWRLGRERLAVDGWYPLAAGPSAPLASWQSTAREVLRAPSTYALASLLQAWAGSTPELDGASCPATVLWGDSDRSHQQAGSDPRGLLAHLPNARFLALTGVGHFADVEAPQHVLAEIQRLHRQQ